MLKSPFPGMDPYLEQHWHDVHTSLVFLAKSALQSQLGEELVARNDERVVAITANGEGESEPAVERFIEIIDVARDSRVITVIEFVSPNNKQPGDGQRKYQQQQQACCDARVNLVEIDLTRQGERRLLVRGPQLPPGAQTTFSACVCRTWVPRRRQAGGQFELYGLPLRQRLPAIRIPLRPVDADVVFDLQSLIDGAYDAGGYSRTLDYAGPCAPPLDPDDAAWADELLRRAYKR
jgi:hypothetical protein